MIIKKVYTKKNSGQVAKKMHVVQHRDSLTSQLDSIRPRIEEGITAITNVQEEIKSLRIVSAKTAMGEKRFKVEKTYFETVKVSHPVQKGTLTTFCKNCQRTCHPVCGVRDKSGCACIDQSTGRCTNCPKKCHYNVHINDDYTYTYNDEKRIKWITNESLKKAHEKDVSQEAYLKRRIKELQQTVSEQELLLVTSISNVKSCLDELQRIALVVEYTFLSIFFVSLSLGVQLGATFCYIFVFKFKIAQPFVAESLRSYIKFMISQEISKKTERAARKVKVLSALLQNVEILHNIRDDKRDASSLAKGFIQMSLEKKEAEEKEAKERRMKRNQPGASSGNTPDGAEGEE